MEFVEENARKLSEMLAQMRERGELDYFYSYLVDEYPDEIEEMVTELKFWFPEESQLRGVGHFDEWAAR